ncbi:hypothetical protein AURDEDRAFT_179780 [Auricularia subglabra TFB-10046 SS5]|nr:hypothetical protein AURDEDRAFT_179780 [Auricularia subglabra TFB-10046 SS5]
MASTIPDLRLTLGVFEVGVSVTMFLVGILLLQTFNYFRSFPKDSVFTKATVAGVFFLDLVHSVLLVHAVYHYTIANFGHPNPDKVSVATLNGAVVLGALISLLAQGYFSVCILRVSASRILGVGCLSLVLVKFAFGFLVAIRVCISNSIITAQEEYRWQFVAALAIGTATDVAIAGSLGSTLFSQQSGLRSSDAFLDKVMSLVLSSGLLAALLAIIELVTFLAMDNYVWLAFHAFLAKIYANALLSSLNEREVSRSATASSRMPSTSRQPTNPAGSLMIFKHTSVELHDGDHPGDVPSPRDKSFGLTEAV